MVSKFIFAPRRGLGPLTFSLTATCSTVELPGKSLRFLCYYNNSDILTSMRVFVLALSIFFLPFLLPGESIAVGMRVGAPSSLKVQKIEQLADHKIKITIDWEDEFPSPLAYYTVFAQVGKEEFASIGTVKMAPIEITANDMSPFFAIKVKKSVVINQTVSEGDFSDALAVMWDKPTPIPSATPTPTPVLEIPHTPQQIQLKSENRKDGKRELELTWDQVEQADGYAVYVSTGTGYKKMGIVVGNAIILTAPENIVTFTVAISAYNALGESERVTIEITGETDKIELVAPLATSTPPQAPSITQAPAEVFKIHEAIPTSLPTPTPTLQVQLVNASSDKNGLSLVRRIVEFMKQLLSRVLPASAPSTSTPASR